MALFLGVDAGNSKTVALLADAEGKVYGEGRSGNGDIYGADSPALAVDAVVAAVTAAMTSGGVTTADVAGAAFRLAGVDWPEDETFWQDQVAARLPGLRRCSFANDGYAAIRCGEPSGVGVAIVAGTGPAIAGRGPGGRRWSTGFWVGSSLGANDLGSEAVRAVLDSAMGLGPPTALTERLLAFFGHGDVESMLHHLTRRDGPSRDRQQAAAAPEVTTAAAEGDAVAGGIVARLARGSVDHAWAVARRVGYDTGTDAVPVVLAGSVLAGGGCATDAVVRMLPERIPNARPRLAVLPPVAGALLDAVAESGAEITPGVTARLGLTYGAIRPASPSADRRSAAGSSGSAC